MPVPDVHVGDWHTYVPVALGLVTYANRRSPAAAKAKVDVPLAHVDDVFDAVWK